jgi:hypothetical protein
LKKIFTTPLTTKSNNKGEKEEKRKKMTKDSNVAFWLYVVGVAIVLLSHLWLLNRGTRLNAEDIYHHALLNLFAVFLLIGGWYMHSEEDAKICPQLARKGKMSAGDSLWEKLTGMMKPDRPARSVRSVRSMPDDEEEAAEQVRRLLLGR